MMYSSIYELPTDVRNCFDEKDQEVFMKAYNELNPQSESDIKKALRKAWRACAKLPSSFSFKAIATGDTVDVDHELIDVDTVCKNMDAFIDYGGNINWEHRDMVTGRIWDWEPVIHKGKKAVAIYGNLYGGRDIYDQVREMFLKGRNGFSLGGQASPVDYRCDERGCYLKRNVDNIFEISVVKNPANPMAETLEFNAGNMQKSAGGINMSIEEYELHKDYTTCPIAMVKHALEEDGFVELHSTEDGVTMPCSYNDNTIGHLVGDLGYVVRKHDEDHIIVSDRRWETERTFKKGWDEGWMAIDGSIKPNIPEERFKALYNDGLICQDSKGRFVLDTFALTHDIRR